MQQHINTHDLASLKSLWNYLDLRLFCRLEQVHANAVKRLETSLFKYYAISCIQSNRYACELLSCAGILQLFLLVKNIIFTYLLLIPSFRQDRLLEFFENCAGDIQSQPEWKDWFGNVTK